MTRNEFGSGTVKLDQKNVALVSTFIPEIMQDCYRSLGGILLLEKSGIVDPEFVEQFQGLLTTLNERIVATKGLVTPTR